MIVPKFGDFTVEEALEIADRHGKDVPDNVPSVSRTLAAEVRRLASPPAAVAVTARGDRLNGIMRGAIDRQLVKAYTAGEHREDFDIHAALDAIDAAINARVGGEA